ncbi:MAG: heavy metal translocating P-type ATPase, partial [Gemmatimonadaceae bacterium]
ADDNVHVGPAAAVASRAALCLHYDPERLSLRQIADIATRTGVGLTMRYAHDVIAIKFIGAEDSASRLEDGLKRLDGVTAATVSLPGQVVRVEYDTTVVNRQAIDARLQELGAHLVERPAVHASASTRVDAVPDAQVSPEHAQEETASWYTRNRELAWSLGAGMFLLLGVIAQRISTSAIVPLTLFAIAYVFGARDNVGHFLKDVRKGHFRFDIDLLMVVAAVGAAILGQWREGALLLFLFSLGHAAEHYAMGRARNAIKALADLAPSEASVIRDGVTQRIPIAEVCPGDRVVIKPGERVSVDGAVREGTSAVNQAPITGESVPVDKVVGDSVFAGSVNGDGALVVEVTAATGDRTLDRVIKLVAEAQTQKAPTQQFTDRFERIFVPLVLGGDLLLMIAPPLLGVWSWHEAVYRALTVLVASSPCALALGTPAAVLAGIAQAARNGVLIKGGAHLESLGAIRTLALDKTGTITRGTPQVTDVIAADGVADDALVTAAAGVEARSQHPLAHAILEEAKRRGVTVAESTDVEAVSGKGVRGYVGDVFVEAGRALFFETAGQPSSGGLPAGIRDAIGRVEGSGRTAIVVRQTGGRGKDSPQWLGVLGVADTARANALVAIERLRSVGIERVLMLTGDNARVGHAVATEVGIQEVRADLLPEDKLSIIKDLVREGPVAMVGDGVNDAPALAHATVGIAMGGAGTAAALETADVALMGDDLERLVFAIGLSRQARSVIRQNLAISLGVIVVLVVAAVTGRVGIGTAVVFHEGSTLVVIANGLRLLAYRKGLDVTAVKSSAAALREPSLPPASTSP